MKSTVFTPYLPRQIAAALDYWHTRTPPPPARPPRYNVLLVSGPGRGVFMHPDGLAPALAANGPPIREWYWRARKKLDLHARGFTISQVIP